MSTGRAHVSRVYNTRVVEERRDVFVLSKACPRGFFQKRGALYEISYSSLHRPLPSPPSPPPRPPFEAPTSLLPFTYPSRERHPSKTETDGACKVQQTRQGYQRRLAEKSIASAALRMEACV